MTASLGDVFGGLAFLLSIYATIKTIKFNERQKALIEAQEKLTNLQLAKEANELESSKKADVSANIVNIGNNKYKLKVFNKGKSPAKNVRIEFPDNNSPVSMSDVESKFPFESLVAYQSVDLIASGELGRASKFTVRLIWDDDFQDGNESVVHVTY
ncbi:MULTISPECIES: hypothetical protein [Raoultella]|uniref:hypothetical protein n=1 Tax=Raoultella TaxID=160674 RepID=UPI0019063CEF|nr:MULTISPECIES: hypothetical protein [Raoultella]MDX7497796.1 hypothetical protein [Raoultella ornithinolytica]QQN41317.1 hypothetical protein JGY86_13240 [Raoultella sp. XY-1]HAT7496867.1 hypothetical protein [Raoultella ornithinolytica]